MTKFRFRATTAFQHSVRGMDRDVQAMLAEHAVAGRLQSGATVKAALRIFEERSSAALSRTLDETAKLVEHRGRRWSRAMEAIGDALDEHLVSGRSHLESTIRVADPQGSPSVSTAVDQRLDEIGQRLREQLAEFRDGWTAPAPKPWKDRRPLLYAVLLLIIGALVGVAVRELNPS